MGRIRILSDHIANKIAAGEVVERPASVVKELLENSLDAGATDILILVEAGGRRLIRIADDGHGMLRDDALLAFERHATSKLSDANDLLAIATLGFRGEALPSIASVSRLLLETRSPDEESGTRVEIAGGRILSCEDLARTPGTTITIRDLFYNVPARKKFLRSEQTELAHIASLVTHYSLAHPTKGFALQHGEHDLLHVAPVETLEERVYQVFGNQILQDLVDIGVHERDVSIPAPYVPEEEAGEPSTRTFRLRGFISGPQVQKLNRNSIYLFVNGRLIRDKVLMHALTAGYHNLIPPASYPFALLFLDCDPEEVDVNVHPAKTEVRFRHSGTVHDFVRDAIRGILTERRPVAGISAVPVVSDEQPGAQLPYSEFSQRMENAAYSQPPPSELPVMQTGLPEFTLHRPLASPAPRFAFQDSEPTPAGSGGGGLRLPVPDTHGRVLPESALVESPTLEALKDLRPLGQLHDSFIIAAGRDGLWLVDQHVAHERILFEQVMRQRGRAPETQALLMPIVLQLSAAQQIEYARIAEELNAMGFETEPFGHRTIAVKAAPAGVSAGDIEKVLFEVLEIAEKEFRKASLEDMRRGIAASIACRAAIKINMRLDQRKMEWLLQELAKTEHPMSCPHGRPIALRYTMREILRSFHRM
ncbi:DNA mismatch repair protein MutL [Bryobacterales bacterium F-183]|nr:DNA mismatch repair protein MutL [Bryobacterales bacterium F-183]